MPLGVRVRLESLTYDPGVSPCVGAVRGNQQRRMGLDWLSAEVVGEVSFNVRTDRDTGSGGRMDWPGGAGTRAFRWRGEDAGACSELSLPGSTPFSSVGPSSESSAGVRTWWAAS